MAAIERLDDSSWQRVLCVVAHPDDLEYGTSAAVAAWTQRGVEVSYLLLTSGEAGMQRPPHEVGPLRAAEQRTACQHVGVNDLTILDFPDGMLEYSLDLRRAIARVVRQRKPDAVVTALWDVEAYGGLNQADHRAAGLAAVDGVRDADNTWVFPELAADEGLPKWHTKAILVAGHPDATHGVEVSETDVKASVASLQAHAAYLADLPGHPAPAEFIPQISTGGGEALGTEYAVTFRVRPRRARGRLAPLSGSSLRCRARRRLAPLSGSSLRCRVVGAGGLVGAGRLDKPLLDVLDAQSPVDRRQCLQQPPGVLAGQTI